MRSAWRGGGFGERAGEGERQETGAAGSAARAPLARRRAGRGERRGGAEQARARRFLAQQRRMNARLSGRAGGGVRHLGLLDVGLDILRVADGAPQPGDGDVHVGRGVDPGVDLRLREMAEKGGQKRFGGFS